ncbi:MAG: DUF5626 family protein [Erysipelothrix sp.]|nr:DUF5626 family protein [Erysipelothrix sp.]
MKRSILFLVLTLIVGLQSSTIRAEYSSEGVDNTMNKSIATFDLDYLQRSETYIIYDDFGAYATITLERVINSDQTNNSKAIQNDSYRIHYSTLAEKISYIIDVKNNSIVSAHSGSYSVFGYSVKSSSLRVIHAKYASYSLECSFLLRSWTNRLNAYINSNNDLEIRFNS